MFRKHIDLFLVTGTDNLSFLEMSTLRAVTGEFCINNITGSSIGWHD